MSSTGTGFPEEEQRRAAQDILTMNYVPTEEEKRALKECDRESFYYRSLPFSVVSMAVTQALVARGTLSASPRWGSLPKVAFAGFFAYLAGKVSYTNKCQEKIKNLENSPLGESLRQRAGQAPRSFQPQQSELSDPGVQFQPAETPSHSRDYGYGSVPEPPSEMSRPDDFSAPAQPYVEEDEPRRKPILYENLRLKNRENYEVTLSQKADTMLRAPPDRELERPKKEVKKNIYGDTWEE